MGSFVRAALVAALVCAAAPAHATMIAPLDVDQLVAGADVIAYGRVESLHARWVGGHSAIVTEVTLRATRGLKGIADGERVVFWREGGSTGGIGMRVVGAASFAVGEEAVVFLERRGAALYTVGMALGKYRVVRAADGTATAVPGTAGLAFVRPPAPGQYAPRPLDVVLRDLAARVARGAK